MTTENTASIKPNENGKETLLGMILSLEQRFGCQPRLDTSTTLNTKFDVFADMPPLNPRVVHYFTWGNKGRLNDASNLTSAQYVSGTNMAPYGMMPFRAVPEEADLTAEERKKYGLRVIQVINGVRYVLYYLKRVVYTEGTVQLQRLDPVSGITVDYEIDPDNLDPVAPISDDTGLIEDVADSISAVVPGSIQLTGEEVIEVVNVLYGGDMRWAVASELGFVAASIQTVSAQNAQGQSFDYEEAIFAQMVDHWTWIGQAFVHTSGKLDKTLLFSSSNTVSQS